jgi:hypothetical protein
MRHHVLSAKPARQDPAHLVVAASCHRQQRVNPDRANIVQMTYFGVRDYLKIVPMWLRHAPNLINCRKDRGALT